MTDTRFTYQEARAQLDTVRRATLAANERLEQLKVLAETLAEGTAEEEKLKVQMSEVVEHWAHAIAELGAQAKGLWTVDFDSGLGFYYCWTLNEPELTHYHAYEDGFPGRKPLVDGVPPDFPDAKSPILN